MALVLGRHADTRAGTRFRLSHIFGRWEWAGLAAVLAVSACLNFIRLSAEGYANSYYAAAVKSMLLSWHNFFFVSFDPGGFVSVDKPPLGLWVQAASAKLFGFSGLSLLLPQAIAGVLSVALVYYLVRRAFGLVAGLVAGAALAVTPISVVTDRNNTMDAQLVLLMLLGVWALFKAAETARRWCRRTSLHRPLNVSHSAGGTALGQKWCEETPVTAERRSRSPAARWSSQVRDRLPPARRPRSGSDD